MEMNFTNMIFGDYAWILRFRDRTETESTNTNAHCFVFDLLF